MTDSIWQNAATFEVAIPGTHVFVRRMGTGPALLLLHGFPQTHLMWREIAPVLAAHFTVIAADLPGYGQSGCRPSADDHFPHSKRQMAQDLVDAMHVLGFDAFGVAGHDRGGRIAYRMALDHPDIVVRLAVLDIVPTLEVWDRADWRFAASFWPWSLLSQPAPLPETLIASSPTAIINDSVANWGSGSAAFPAEIRDKYAAALADPEHVHAICEEYRAGASIDIDHDRTDREARRRITCPLLALWSGTGPVGKWYETEGGPLALWNRWAEHVAGEAVPGGHFFPEETPQPTSDRLATFFLS